MHNSQFVMLLVLVNQQLCRRIEPLGKIAGTAAVSQKGGDP